MIENSIRKQNFIKIGRRTSENTVSGWLFLLLTAMYTVAYNETLRAISILWYGVSAVTILVLLLLIVFNKPQGGISFFTGWAFIFFAYSALSCLWALDVEPIFETMKTLLLVFATHVLLAETIKSKKDIENILWANFIALLLVALFILLTMDLSSIGQDRIGVDGLGSLWNANDIGLKMCVGAVISLYFALKLKVILKRIPLLLCAAFFVILALFTGSRKVVIMIIAVGVLIFFLKAKKHRSLVLVIGAVMTVALYFVTIKVDALYNVLGSRLEELINGLFQGGTTEGSFNLREEMISMGINWFTERPIFGYGLSNFRVLYGEATGWATYSHNNFVEVLVGGGLVGFIIYFSAYAYVFVKLIKSAFKERNLLAILFFSLNTVVLVLQVALVSFSSTLFNCLLCLSFGYINVRERE